MDVHKSFLVACIASTNNQGVTTYVSKRFSTFTGDLRKCSAWLANHNCKDVCMESTGKYWIPIYNILEPTCNIVLAHPKYVKAIRGKKTDKKDAKWIADIFKHDLVSGSFIPPADIRQLRDLVRYRWKLTNFTTGEKNRAQNCLTVSNIKLDDVFSDVFGKAATAITTRLLEAPSEKLTDVSAFRTKGMKATDEQILAAVDGEMCVEQAEKLRIIRSHMDGLEFLKSAWICPCSRHPSIFALGRVLHLRTTKAPERRKLPESAEPELTSNRCLFSVRCVQFVRKATLKFEIATIT